MSEGEGESDGVSRRVLMEQLAVHTASRAVSKTVMAPFDRVKFLLQCERELIRQGRASHAGFGGMRACVCDVVQYEGWRSLWRGNLVHCASVFPIAVGQAYVGQPATKQLQQWLPSHDAASATISYVLSTFLGVMFVQAIAYPFDMMRFRLACDTARPPSTDYLYKTSYEFTARVAQHGEQGAVSAMYRGLPLFLSGSIMYRFTFMSLYSMLLPYTPKATDKASLTDLRAAYFAHSFLNWMCISLATVWAYPVDTVRRRMMLTVNSQLQYVNFLDCASYIIKSEGQRGLFRGVTFTLMRGVLTALLTGVVGVSFYSQ